VSTDDLVARSDYIILATVLVPETMNIINKDRLALMKPNAVIINVGRGSEYTVIYGKGQIVEHNISRYETATEYHCVGV